jgi:hypothetical protein
MTTGTHIAGEHLESLLFAKAARHNVTNGRIPLVLVCVSSSSNSMLCWSGFVVASLLTAAETSFIHSNNSNGSRFIVVVVIVIGDSRKF